MTFDSSNSWPIRGRPIHQPSHKTFNRAVIVFLTVCTDKRRPVLANAETHRLLLDSWLKAGHWMIGRYVIMPDHIHLFCSPGTLPPHPMAAWISYWKRLVTFSQGSSFWQKNYWDTQLRAHEGYDAKWEYVRQNPVRAGLVVRPDDWPYQGELNILRWHD